MALQEDLDEDEENTLNLVETDGMYALPTFWDAS